MKHALKKGVTKNTATTEQKKLESTENKIQMNIRRKWEE